MDTRELREDSVFLFDLGTWRLHYPFVMAGYAGTPLPKKLGIKAGHKVCLLDAPRAFVRRLTHDDVRIADDLRLPPVDVAVLFVDRMVDLERRFAHIAARLHPAGGFWVAWPKKRRGADITEEVVRRIALAVGMIDNKACSIGDFDCVRLVLRVEHRDAWRIAPSRRRCSHAGCAGPIGCRASHAPHAAAPVRPCVAHVPARTK